MQTDEKELELERAYLEKVVGLAGARFVEQKELAVAEKKMLMELSRHMYENTVHFSHDFARLTEANQALGDIETRTINYRMQEKQLRRYERMMEAPYFARIDFTEDGFDREALYIGIGNLADDDGLDVYVYDWRAPVSSLFYQNELGKASYQAPMGKIAGTLDLKRQYEIKNGALQYFFDASVNVMDDILRSVLAKNASPMMKSIVETIQREQDAIIRDMSSDLLMVQGTAGSGKTSVALHRVAFLMYQSTTNGLSAENIIILSPNALFGKYISGVLPELGEENVATVTFEEFFEHTFGESPAVGTRAGLLEQLMTTPPDRCRLLTDALGFWFSAEFVQILDRMIAHYETSMLQFTDVFYGDECIATQRQIVASLQDTHVELPLAKRLRMVEARIFEEVHKRKKARMDELEKEVREEPQYQFEIKAQVRLRSIREVSSLAHKVRCFTRPNAQKIYRALVTNKELFFQIAQNVNLPSNISEILDLMAAGLKPGAMDYMHCMALLYLQVKLTGDKQSSTIKQVVIDEAQDYAPLHYELLHLLLPHARYTVLGDINQTIGGNGTPALYQEIQRILKKRGTFVEMNKSFRCSAEIIAFSHRFLDAKSEPVSFDRHDEAPRVCACATQEVMDSRLIADIELCKEQGFGSAAVLCRSLEQAKALYERISGMLDVRLADDDTTIGAGNVIMPIYMAKGLEFDCAFVYGADDQTYYTQDDKRLLYIASTRPLHRLFVYHTGTQSPLLGNA